MRILLCYMYIHIQMKVFLPLFLKTMEICSGAESKFSEFLGNLFRDCEFFKDEQKVFCNLSFTTNQKYAIEKKSELVSFSEILVTSYYLSRQYLRNKKNVFCASALNTRQKYVLVQKAKLVSFQEIFSEIVCFLQMNKSRNLSLNTHQNSVME